MFERFTDGARAAVVRAHDEARALGHRYLGTEHLLLGVAETPDRGRVALDRLGFDVEAARADLVRILGTSPSDDEALRSIGIDIDEVRRRVEEAFGPGALGSDPPRSRGRWRRNRCDAGPWSRRLPFTPRAKKDLELALREAIRLRSDRIGTEHLLLGLVRGDGTVAIRLLRAQGIDPGAVRRAVIETIDRGDDGGTSLVGA